MGTSRPNGVMLAGRKFHLAAKRPPPQTEGMNHRTKAEYFIRGITQGFVEAAEVIAWADEVIVAAPKTEDWMIEISTCGPDERMKVLSQLNTIKGDVDQTALAELLKQKGP